jgi:hypothetical protein
MTDDPKPSSRSRLGRWWWVAGLMIAAAVVVILAPLASPDPDGLERVAEDQGFLERARDAIYNVFPDYHLPFIEDPVLSTIAAGLVGIGLVFGAMWLLGRVLARRRSDSAGPASR